jgi:hypothetical protein
MKERIAFAVIAAFLIVALAVETVSDKRRINDLQSKVAELTQKVTAYDALPTIEEQANCDKQAKAFFNEVDYKGYLKNEYSSHYNVKMRKCFVSIRTTERISDQFWTAIELYDAIERKAYGTYRWHSDKVKKYWEMPPVECSVETSAEGSKHCNSEGEFALLASEYMDVSE